MQTFFNNLIKAFDRRAITRAARMVVAIALAVTCTHVLASGYDNDMPSELKKWLDILQGVGGGVFIIGLFIEGYQLIIHRRINIGGFVAIGVGAVILLCSAWISSKVGFQAS